MKTSELVKLVKGLSKHYTVNTSKEDYVCVEYNGRSMVKVFQHKQYIFYPETYLCSKEFHKLPYSNKLYMLVAEYAMTPIEERKDDPKKYYVKVPHTDDAYYWKFADGVLYVTSNLIWYPEDKQFTMKEIKKLGLENYELVEVEE